jgi:uracil-DNA glycosylase family 4
VNPDPDAADLLQYLADIGWTDLYLPAGSGAPSGAQAPRAASHEREAKALSKGAVTVASGSPSHAVPGATPAIESAGGAAPAAETPRGIGGIGGAAVSVRRPAAEVVAELAVLAGQVSGCRQCKLCTTRTQTVFASGDPHSRLMLVGEGPGAEEDRQGVPFVGAAGELLNRILAAIGLARDAVYVANIVKCRPPGNRDPEPDEVRACRGYLERQIDLVRPAVIVALGRIAAHELLGNDFSLTRLRGEWHEVRGIPVRVTYHPAALLRNAAYKRPTWEDMQLVRDHLRSLAGESGSDSESPGGAGSSPEHEEGD